MMKKLSAAILLLWSIPATALEVESMGFVPVETRYVTGWNPVPMARIVWPEEHEVNAVRCRVREGEDWGPWWVCGYVQYGNKKPILRIPLKGLTPGVHRAMIDLRTPLGGIWKEFDLRVPLVARYAGEELEMDPGSPEWPQKRFPEYNQEGFPWIAWDTRGLYFASFQGEWSIDLLPASDTDEPLRVSPGENPRGLVWYLWEDLRPAIPQLGQVLRISRSGEDPLDLVFLGSGLPMHFGASIVSAPPGADDQGPPPEELEGLYKRIPFDLFETGTDWGNVEREDPGDGPSYYDWSSLHYFGKLYGKGMVYVHPGLYNPWADRVRAEDPERYERLKNRYLDAFAVECLRAGVRYFSCGWNEPELFYFTDREGRFLDELNQTVNPLRIAMPGAQIIAGKFSGGAPGVITSFVRAGFRDNFDILDIHPYNNDPRTGCDIGQVVMSHEALVDLGMGGKRIYLGEGWGPTRDLHQKPRSRHDEPVSREEADFHRQFYWNGYRCLTQPRMDYNPEWVLAAKYFTFNDNVGGTYWKQAARPHYNAKGELDYYLIGNLQFSLEAMKSFFCNGGLVDFYGNPKGEWLFDFPPALPQVRVWTEYPSRYVLSEPASLIRVHVVNANPKPIRDLSIGLRQRNLLWKGELAATSSESLTRKKLEPGEQWDVDLQVRVVSGPTGAVRMAVELDYSFENRRYVADDVIRTEHRHPVTASFDPPQIEIDPGSGEGSVTVELQNNLATPVKGDLFRLVPAGLSVESRPESLDLPPLVSQAYEVTAMTSADTPPGLHDLEGNWGTADALAAVVPLLCARMETPPVIDGDLKDWPEALDLKHTIRMGGTVRVSAEAPPNPFPVPAPVGESVVNRPEGNGEEEETPSPQAESGAPTFTAQGTCMWDDQYLYLAMMVEDSQHRQDYTGPDTWRQDSIQIALDPQGDGPPGGVAPVARVREYLDVEGYGPDDYELSIALTPEGPQVARTWAPEGVSRDLIPGVKAAIKPGAGYTVYEVALPWNEIGPLAPELGGRFRMDVLINDVDEGDRHTLGWGHGIAAGKYPSRMTPVILGP